MKPEIPVSSTLDEETARAEVYGLLAQLYYAPPQAALLEAIRVAPTEAPAAGAFLEEPWRAVVGTVRALSGLTRRLRYAYSAQALASHQRHLHPLRR